MEIKQRKVGKLEEHNDKLSGDSMNILKKLKNIPEEGIKEFASLRIKELEQNSKKINDTVDTIGYILDCNPSKFNLEDQNLDSNLVIDVECLYNGYLPKGMRVVYGIVYSKNTFSKNGGQYYYLDDDSYIYDFCKYIKTKEVENEYELFSYILEFMKEYFGWIETISRDDMFNLLYKNKTTFYEPTIEHNFSEFKGKGNALCSEMSIMAENILTFFGFNSFIVIGYQEKEIVDENEQPKDIEGESHAYNLLAFNDSETGELTEILIDFANWTSVLNPLFKRIGRVPYIAYLEEGIEETINSLCTNREKLSFEDYQYMILKDKILRIVSKSKRKYSIDIVIDNTIQKNTKVKIMKL